MNSTIITAITAACGSLVGAAATIVTTWITQRHPEGPRREGGKAPRPRGAVRRVHHGGLGLTIDALGHSLERPDTFVKLYGILGRIRLVAADPVLDAAEACARQLVDLYAKPNMTVEQIRVAFERDRLDPIRDFSVACRRGSLKLPAAADGAWPRLVVTTHCVAGHCGPDRFVVSSSTAAAIPRRFW